MNIWIILRKMKMCKGCYHNKDGKCTRIGTNGQIGVCWMAPSEGEY